MKKSTLLISASTLLAGCVSIAQAAPLSDIPGAIALWHMETITPNVTDTPTGNFTSDAVLDDDSANPGRNNDLLLGDATPSSGGSALFPPGTPAFPASTKPALTTGGGGVYGEALSFDGNDEAISILAWPGAANTLDSVYVEFYFKEVQNTTGTQVLVNAGSTWEFIVAGGELRWLTFLNSGPVPNNTIALPLGTPGAWRHVIGSHDANGNKMLMLDGNVVSSSPGPLLLTNKSIALGNKENQTRWFTGLIDEVYVGRTAPVPEPSAGIIAVGFIASLALLRRKAMNL